MNSLQDTLYNWLSIKLVVDARPDDLAAKETYELFDETLREVHGVTNVEITKDDTFYYLVFLQKGESKKAKYSRELMEMVIDQIEGEPEKYINYLSIDDSLTDTNDKKS